MLPTVFGFGRPVSPKTNSSPSQYRNVGWVNVGAVKGCENKWVAVVKKNNTAMGVANRFIGTIDIGWTEFVDALIRMDF
jgi:hypothetical protein